MLLFWWSRRFTLVKKEVGTMWPVTHDMLLWIAYSLNKTC